MRIGLLAILLFFTTTIQAGKAVNQDVGDSLTQQTMSPQTIDKTSGQAIYEQHCSVCHQDGVAGAPKFRDPSDWKTRLQNQTLEALTSTAIKGLNAMPAKGTCQECTDTEIKDAIKFMVPK